MMRQAISKFVARHRGPIQFALTLLAFSSILWVLTVSAFPGVMHRIVQILSLGEMSQSNSVEPPQRQIERLEEQLRHLQKIDSTQFSGAASSQMVKYVMDASRNTKVVLSGIQTGEPSPNPDYNAFALSFQGNAGFKDFHTFVHTLESGNLIISIDHLDIKPISRTDSNVQFQMSITIYVKRKQP